MRIQSTDVAVFVVWEPILPSDWGKPTRVVLSRIPDHRAVQFWDKDHLVSKELDHQLAPGQLSYSKRNGIIWDVVALYPATTQWGASPTFIDGNIEDMEPELKKRLQLLLP